MEFDNATSVLEIMMRLPMNYSFMYSKFALADDERTNGLLQDQIKFNLAKWKKNSFQMNIKLCLKILEPFLAIHSRSKILMRCLPSSVFDNSNLFKILNQRMEFFDAAFLKKEIQVDTQNQSATIYSSYRFNFKKMKKHSKGNDDIFSKSNNHSENDKLKKMKSKMKEIHKIRSIFCFRKHTYQERIRRKIKFTRIGKTNRKYLFCYCTSFGKKMEQDVQNTATVRNSVFLEKGKRENVVSMPKQQAND